MGFGVARSARDGQKEVTARIPVIRYSSPLGGIGMRIPILVEPIENGRFRARAGEPLAMCVEGATSKEATGLLTAKLKERFAAGAALWFVELPNGSISNSLDPLEY